MKNSFAAINYNPIRTISDVFATLLVIALPVPVMLIWGDTITQLMACLILAVLMIYMLSVPPNKWWYALMVPFGGFLMAYIIARSAYVTLKQGGIYWRDTFYPLSVLKDNQQ